jgi:thiamine-phosphate pyrophosphorylase
MFPTPSSPACEIVSLSTVKKARELTSMPIFVAGGITLLNIPELTDTGMDGVAVISGILKAADPQAAAADYKNIITKIAKNETVTTG